jgi:hypothetical protein
LAECDAGFLVLSEEHPFIPKMAETVKIMAAENVKRSSIYEYR